MAMEASMNDWIKSTGRLSYVPWKVVLLADQDVADFYFSMVPKHVGLKRQAYPAHVSVVRKETPPNMEAWGRHEGELIQFEYGGIEHDETYYWLAVRAPRLIEIREELGLAPYPPWRNGYHLTIGNLKHEGPSRMDRQDLARNHRENEGQYPTRGARQDNE
jgi:hypothetical protein